MFSRDTIRRLAMLIKSRRSMELVKTFTAPSGHNYVYALTTLSGYVYAGYDTSPGKVDKISPSTMELVKTFIAPLGHNYALKLTSL